MLGYIPNSMKFSLYFSSFLSQPYKKYVKEGGVHKGLEIPCGSLSAGPSFTFRSGVTEV
jgi:hypothetical protein